MSTIFIIIFSRSRKTVKVLFPASPERVIAIPTNKEKMMIGSMSALAKDSIGFRGTRAMRFSKTPGTSWGLNAELPERLNPLPGLIKNAKTIPIPTANKVVPKNKTNALTPIRPNFLTSSKPAEPQTKDKKTTGTTSICKRRTKICPPNSKTPLTSHRLRNG